ncbi:MAG TPA: hypothetical protein VNA69_12465 [Thermoanaerobaculia bacterium]|nr:hypothetical protein [Thermoanaerobaculia bacterium]
MKNDETTRRPFSIFNFQFSIWPLAAAISAYACHLAVHHATPIDRALPFIAVIVVFVAAFTHVAVALAVPALMVVEIAVADEMTRLLSFGVILAIGLPGYPVARWLDGDRVTGQPGNRATIALTIATILLLRWIPIENALIPRELFLLALAVAITLVLGNTPFAAAVAIVTALVTPAVPLRTFALPLAVLFVATLARLFGMPRLRLALPSAIVIAFALTFFAWSGIVARAFPYFLREPRPAGERYTVNAAIPPAQTVTLSVPDGARALIVSGANVPHFRRGTLLGRIDTGAGFSPPKAAKGRPAEAGRYIDVRIGDAADWGYLRRDQYYGSRNPLPRDPAGKIRDYGYLAWIDGAGRVPLPRGAKTIRVTAAATLPAGATLQVEAFEIATR